MPFYDYVKVFFHDFWQTLVEMSPYLLFGFFVAGVLSVLISQHTVERHLGKTGLMPLVKATVFGVPLPLCSCGVIPVSMSLHRHGASKGSTIAFLLSTPQTGVDGILVTLGLLGPVFAIFRPLAALVTGLLGGTLVNLFGKSSPGVGPKAKCSEACCTESQGKISAAFRYGFISLPRDIGKALLVGIAVAAVISVIVPDGYFADKLGVGILPMFLMMLLGIPVYVCATASVPVAAALMIKGVSPGAALVFLMTGPATNAASFFTIWKTLGSRTALLYILTVGGCALFSGIILDSIFASADLPQISRASSIIPAVIKHISAGTLLVMLGFAMLRPQRRAKSGQQQS